MAKKKKMITVSKTFKGLGSVVKALEAEGRRVDREANDALRELNKIGSIVAPSVAIEQTTVKAGGGRKTKAANKAAIGSKGKRNPLETSTAVYTPITEEPYRGDISVYEVFDTETFIRRLSSSLVIVNPSNVDIKAYAADLIESVRQVRWCLGNPTSPRPLKNGCVKLSSILSRLLAAMEKHKDKPEAYLKAIILNANTNIQEVISEISEVLMDRREDVRVNKAASALSKPFPSIVLKEPVFVEDTPVILTVDGSVPSNDPKIKFLSAGHCLAICSFVGVPSIRRKRVNIVASKATELQLSKQFETAKKAALRHFGIEPYPIRVIRPDSDAVWFCVIVPTDRTSSLSLQIKSIVWPEEFASTSSDHTYDSKLEASLKEMRRDKLRDIRLKFEAEHADLYSQLNSLTKQVQNFEAEARVLRELFKSRVDLLPSSKEINIRLLTHRLMNQELAGERSIRNRLMIRVQWMVAEKELLGISRQYKELRHKIRAIKARLAAINNKIDLEKLRVRNPSVATFLSKASGVTVSDADKNIDTTGVPLNKTTVPARTVSTSSTSGRGETGIAQARFRGVAA